MTMERMNQAQTLRELSHVLRTLFTAFLLTIGFGYLAAVFYLFLVDIDPHLKMGMGTIAGIEMKYRMTAATVQPSKPEQRSER